MATETEQLVYELQATFDKFAASFDSATKTAQDNFERMDTAGKQAGDRMSQINAFGCFVDGAKFCWPEGARPKVLALP